MAEESSGNDVEDSWWKKWKERRRNEEKERRELKKLGKEQGIRSWIDARTKRKIDEEKLESLKRERRVYEKQEKTAKAEQSAAERRKKSFGTIPDRTSTPAENHQGKRFKGEGSLATLVVVGVLIWFFFGTTFGQSTLTNVRTSLDNLGFEEKIAFFSGNIRSGFDPGSHQFVNPRAESTGESSVFGMRIRDFSAVKSFYEINEELKLIGIVEVDNSIESNPNPKELNLNFRCSSGNVEGKISLSDTHFSTMKVLPGDETNFQVFCNFPKDTFSIKEGEREQSYKIDFEVLYDYNVRSGYEIYVVETLDEKKDFFKKMDLLGKGNILPDGTVLSFYQGGPVEVNIGFGRFNLKQPLILGNYRFFIGLVNNREIWGGQMEELKNLNLVLPKEITLDENNCEQFDVQGRLKKEILDKINDPKCKSFDDVTEEFRNKEKIGDVVISGFGCLDDYLDSSEFSFSCTLNVKSSGEAIDPLVLRSFTNYRYKTDKSTSVKFIDPSIVSGLKEKGGDDGQ